MVRYMSQSTFDYLNEKVSKTYGLEDGDKDTFDLVTEIYDYLLILSHFKQDDEWIDKHIFDTKLPKESRDTVRTMVNDGLLIRDNRPRPRTDGSSKRQKTYLSFAIAPILRPVLKQLISVLPIPFNSNDDDEKEVFRLILSYFNEFEDFDGLKCKMSDITSFRRYMPYHLLRMFHVNTELITTKQLEAKYQPNKEEMKSQFNKKDLSKIMKDMGTSARLDLCEDVYRFIFKSKNDGVTKREIVNELWLKHAYEYTLQHIDTVCRILIRAGYVKEYDTSKELVYCDSLVKDEDIPKRERLIRSKEEMKRDEYLILKAMEHCETSYRYKDIENLTGINESAVYNTVNDLVKRGLIKRIEDGISAVSFANLDYEGLCREVHEKEIEYGMATDNGHTYTAVEQPVEEQQDIPKEEHTEIPNKEEYDYPTALAKVYDGIAVVSMSSAKVYHLIAGKGLRCADDISEPINSFSKEEKEGKWRDMPDIKECPFCKSKSSIQFNNDRTEYWCECEHCHISTRHESSIITAVSTWNTRA